MTIGVLAPYRRLGIGKRLLKEVLNACRDQADCQEIYLHVQAKSAAPLTAYLRFLCA